MIYELGRIRRSIIEEKQTEELQPLWVNPQRLSSSIRFEVGADSSQYN